MKKILFFSALIFILSCGSKANKNNGDTFSENATIKEKPAQQAAVPFPVYMAFDEFEHHIRQNNDTTYVVNFWATWCKPCVAELPFFEKLISEKKGQAIKVLLVSMDFPKQIKSKLIPFVKEKKLEKNVVALADMDYNSWIDKVSGEWDGAIPFTYIYNNKNKVIKTGEMDGYEELEELLKKVDKS
ncbi:MAG TPA: TlpA family protein disulfide reductase [Bacteroidetes bacterium]|nr:TlpA family protein disulfide reductase [Bacteroidota bacterium]